MIPSDLLVSAYASGWFPMAVGDRRDPLVSRRTRAASSRSTASTSPRVSPACSAAAAFRSRSIATSTRVIRACAEADRKEEEGGTWIDAEIMESYCALHRAGLAHSVEAWQGRAAGRRRLRRRARRRVLRRIDVPPRDRRLQGRARRPGRPAAQRADTRCSTSSGSRPHLERFGAIEIPRRSTSRCSRRRSLLTWSSKGDAVDGF